MKPFLSFLRRTAVYLLPLFVLAIAIGVRLFQPDLLERLSLISFDFYQRADPRVAGDVPIRIVDIDDESLKRIGQWPWPRGTIAQLVDKLRQGGAAVVAFDILFSEPDRTSASLMLPLIAKGVGEEEAKRIVATMSDPDAELAAAMRQIPVVAGFALANKGGTGLLQVKAGFATNGGADRDPLVKVPDFADAIADLPALQSAAAGNGFLNQDTDWDHVVRRVPLLLRYRGHAVPSLVAEVLRVYQGAHQYIARGAGANAERSFGENTGLTDLKVGNVVIPTDSKGRMWVHFALPENDRYISAADVLDGKVDPAKLADSIVLIGSSATGLNDLQATPVAPEMPGVEVHAQLIQQAAEGDFLNQPDWSTGAETLFTAIAGIMLILVLPRIGALPSAVLGAAAVVAAVGSSWLAFRDEHWLLDPVYPIIILTLVYALATLLGYLRTEARQRQIRSAFSRYMSPHYVEELAKHPEKLVLGGESRELTVMFCDIRGFTTISEGLNAQALTTLINNFLAPMTEIITEHKGTIDKYIGDCIMAFWNAPLDDAEHPKNAVRAAQQMRRRLAELNRQWEAEAQAAGKPYRPLRIGIGLNSGECTVGNFGSMQRFDYSILGDAVNLASRVEGLGKLYGVDLVIAEETASRLDEPELIELDLVAVKGKSQAVHVYTLPPEPIAEVAFANQHSALLAAYRKQDWSAALGLLDDARLAAARNLVDVYELYRRRIAHFQLEAPPGNWDGVFTAEEK